MAEAHFGLKRISNALVRTGRLKMKNWLIGAGLVALSACSQPAPPAGSQAGSIAPAPVASQWLMIARTDSKGGGIYVDPTLKHVDPATGLSDVTLKVVKGDLNAIDAEGGSTASLYREELVTFRFDCAKRSYALVKREAINKQGAVIDTTAPEITPASYREVAPGGVASVAQGQACPQK
jgi:hypothetical protein